MGTTKIEWAGKVWNPTTGCSKISEGCKNCYAERFSRRLKHIPATRLKYRNGFRPTVHSDDLTIPYTWKKPSVIFVGSMGDLFHESIPFSFIAYIIKVIKDCSRHDFMLLTKRPERMREFFVEYMPVKHNLYVLNLKNIWLGVSVENQAAANIRIPELLCIPCRKRFISCEPLLDQVSLHTFDIHSQVNNQKRLNEKLHLVIAGGETGPGARKTKLYTFLDLIMDCDFLQIPFFLKGFGSNKFNLTIDLKN